MTYMERRPGEGHRAGEVDSESSRVARPPVSFLAAALPLPEVVAVTGPDLGEIGGRVRCSCCRWRRRPTRREPGRVASCGAAWSRSPGRRSAACAPALRPPACGAWLGFGPLPQRLPVGGDWE